MRSALIVLLGLALMIASGVLAAAPEDGFTPADEHGRYVYLIRFSEPGLMEQAGGAEGLRGATAEAHRAFLHREQGRHIERMASVLEREVAVSHRYLVTHSGIAARLTADEAARAAALPAVVAVEREPLESLHTYRGPTFIGADAIWDGSAVPDGFGNEGGGVVIGVLDTGVAPGHPSFQNDPACGHGDSLPDKLLSYVDCAATDSGGRCNGSNPADSHGHGSHTAGTAGGNRLGAGASPPPAPPAPFTEVSGVAPCASIRAYKVCPVDNCPGANILAGIGNAIEDAVDVINFSISGGLSPWSDHNRRFLDAVDAGIFVAASAGNTSSGVPNPVGQVNHRGPWMMTVAASTRDAPSAGLLSVSGPGVPPLHLRNIVATAGSESPDAPAFEDLPIRHFPGQDVDMEGCTPGEDGVPPGAAGFPDGFFDDAAALIRRGTCPFSTKINNAFAAGAVLVIIRNNQEGTINMLTPGQANVPAYSIDVVPGNSLKNFVSDNPDTATIAFDPIAGDVLAGFSLRGPTPAPLADLTKPDITAPGVNIYAAIPGGYGSSSGTSMSSPHVAGAAALLRAVRPDWTPSEIKSAIQMTAHRAGRKESMVETWDADDVGSGRVDLRRAALAGLVMDETFGNYLAANPGGGGDVKTLNLASMRNSDCEPACSFTRTLTSALDETAAWEVTVGQPTGFFVDVTPDSFTLAPGEDLVLTITATPLGGEPGAAFRFGAAQLNTVTPEQSPELHLTLALRGTGSPERPIIAVNPGVFFLSLESGAADERMLTISNPGQEPLLWSAGTCGALPAWLDVTPASGTTLPEDFDELTLSINTGGLAVDVHEAELCIESNDLFDPEVMVPVQLTVTELVMEADLSVAFSVGDGTLVAGQAIDYALELHNAGPRDVTGARIITSMGDGLTDIHWTCQAGPGGVCPGNGSGDLNQRIDLDAGASMTFQIVATPVESGTGGQIVSTAMIFVPDNLTDPNSGNNLDQVSVQVVLDGVFSDRFGGAD